jgi:hypothetical protein
LHIAENISTISSAIELAVAPVFLLTGISGLLAVMSTRLSRVVDRFRSLNEGPSESQQNREEEIDLLLRRSRWVHWAISLSVIAALFICIVIVSLFLGAEVKFDPSRLVSLLFISAIVMLICGLVCFLREIFLSTGLIEK